MTSTENNRAHRSLDNIPNTELFVGKRVRSTLTNVAGSIARLDFEDTEGTKVWIEWDNKNWSLIHKFAASCIVELVEPCAKADRDRTLVKLAILACARYIDAEPGRYGSGDLRRRGHAEEIRALAADIEFIDKLIECHHC